MKKYSKKEKIFLLSMFVLLGLIFCFSRLTYLKEGDKNYVPYFEICYSKDYKDNEYHRCSFILNIKNKLDKLGTYEQVADNEEFVKEKISYIYDYMYSANHNLFEKNKSFDISIIDQDDYYAYVPDKLNDWRYSLYYYDVSENLIYYFVNKR